jgi:predicted CopG family antitoxin
VVKQIKVSDEVYMKLSQLKQELDENTFNGVVSQLIKVYEGLKTYGNLKQLLQLFNDLQNTLATIDQLLSTTLATTKSVETKHGSAHKEASKSDISSYFKR